MREAPFPLAMSALGVEALQALGVLHIEPINPAQAVASAEVAMALDGVRRAVQILEGAEPAGSSPGISAQAAVDEVLAINRAQAEADSRLSSLYRQLEQQAIWGDVTLEDFQILKAANALPTFYLSSREQASEFAGEFVSVVGEAG